MTAHHMAKSSSQVCCGCLFWRQLMILLNKTSLVEIRDPVIPDGDQAADINPVSQKQEAAGTASETTSTVDDDGGSLSSLSCKTSTSGGSCDLQTELQIAVPPVSLRTKLKLEELLSALIASEGGNSDIQGDLLTALSSKLRRKPANLSQDASSQISCGSKLKSGSDESSSGNNAKRDNQAAVRRVRWKDWQDRLSEQSHDLNPVNARPKSRDTFGEERYHANSDGSSQKSSGNCGGTSLHGSAHAEHSGPTPFGRVRKHAGFSEQSYDLNAEPNSRDASSEESCYPNSDGSSQKASGNDYDGTSSHGSAHAAHSGQTPCGRGETHAGP
eukprot:TRINITY_DN805_c0_g1_i16.p1 TRINITY_DN805_c0_g1~~TRINITY_DN805_c0_g1_i16.p1  ORF type:complete len:329 (+),score=60.06 TRINITY_DN805_c0_g1_i16:129-1115(+)